MSRAIPLTHYVEYVAQAKAIQQRLSLGAPSAAAVRQGLVDLADLAVKALGETNDVFEGLAALVMALHPAVKRSTRAPEATERASIAARTGSGSRPSKG